LQEAGDAGLQLDDPSEYIDYIKPFQNIRKDKVSIVEAGHGPNRFAEAQHF
jgi:hypothetical protein